VENFKKRMEEIKGTREEMIVQYHEAIVEARKNPETLQYVKDNFQEIFKEGRDKWQDVRDELNSVKELKEKKTTTLGAVEEKIKDIFPQTSIGKKTVEEEERIQKMKKEQHNRDAEREKEKIERLEENIENAKYQKERFSDILDQKVEYTCEEYVSGEAKIISDDATEFTRLWRQFPVHPFVISTRTSDYMVDELQKKGYSNQDIEGYKKKREQLKEVKERIYGSLQKKVARYSEIGFAKSNDVSYPSFPFIHIGHGAHYFDNSLLGKQMTLGELFDQEIEIKSKQLEAIKKSFERLKEEA
jgi:hypothetical protein